MTTEKKTIQERVKDIKKSADALAAMKIFDTLAPEIENNDNLDVEAEDLVFSVVVAYEQVSNYSAEQDNNKDSDVDFVCWLKDNEGAYCRAKNRYATLCNAVNDMTTVLVIAAAKILFAAHTLNEYSLADTMHDSYINLKTYQQGVNVLCEKARLIYDNLEHLHNGHSLGAFYAAVKDTSNHFSAIDINY